MSQSRWTRRLLAGFLSFNKYFHACTRTGQVDVFSHCARIFVLFYVMYLTIIMLFLIHVSMYSRDLHAWHLHRALYLTLARRVLPIS